MNYYFCATVVILYLSDKSALVHSRILLDFAVPRVPIHVISTSIHIL